MKSYKHIFFDLDHTLWDFDRNCSETLDELYVHYNFHELGLFTPEQFRDVYIEVNKRMWKQYNHGEIDRDTIRTKRFPAALLRLGMKKEQIPADINARYMSICPTKSNLFPYTMEILNYLKSRYKLHILTNGFRETQSIKIKSSRIASYFMEVINSEISGFLKPSKEIFQYAMNKVKASCRECIMIGDDLEADIMGARNAGIDHIFFNPLKKQHSENLKHEISCLSELKKIL